MKSPQIASIEPLETRIAPATIFAIRQAGGGMQELISFNSATPGSITNEGVITGLATNEEITDLDFRPATGELYALGFGLDVSQPDTGRIYRLDGNAAILVGAPIILGDVDDRGDYGIDFDPVADSIRIVSDYRDNLSVDPDTGGVFTATALSQDVENAAYSNNFDDATQTTLFGLASGNLVRIGSVGGSPNSADTGVVTTIGPLGVALSSTGFDIESRTGAAFAVFTGFANNNGFYSVNLTSGAATLVGLIGSGANGITAMAIALPNDLTIVNSKLATYIDQDGDLVTLKVTKGGFQPQDFHFAIHERGSYLAELDFSFASRNTTFNDQGLTITATPKAGLGDSFANIGFINAAGIDLGAVSLNGDLTKIIAGDGNTDKTSPGLVSLTVQSMGGFFRIGESLINGPVGKLTIKTDSDGATFRVLSGGLGALSIGGDLRGGGANFDGLIEASGDIGSISIRGSIIGTGDAQNGAIEAGGNIGKVFIGGSLRSDVPSLLDGSITAVGNIGAITVKGDMQGIITAGGNITSLAVGGSVSGRFGNDGAGFVSAGGTLGSLTIVGSLLGDGGDESARIESGGHMGAVKIGGSIRGGAGEDSGSLHSDRNIGAITIGGSLVGGSSGGAGTISAFSPGGISTIGAVKIGGNIEGGSGDSTGEIVTQHFIASVTVGGSVIGSSGEESGTIFVSPAVGSSRGIGPVKIGVDLRGGSADGSGTIAAFGGNIASVTVGGSFSGGADMGIIAGGKLGPVKIGGDISSSGGLLIQARGVFGTPLAIASVTVGGDVSGVDILAGYDYTLGGQTPDVQIGAVTVGGNWLGGSIVAGALANNDIFGDADDTAIFGGNPAIFSKIASITIKGYLTGSFAGSGFVAQEIGKLKIGTATIPLTAGPSNDLTPLSLGLSGIFRVREV